MKIKMFVFIALLMTVGCSRSVSDISNEQSQLYFTDQNNTLYRYDGRVNEVSLNDETTTLGTVSTNELLAANTESINILSKNETVLINIEPNEMIHASTANDALNIIYYATQTGEMKAYNVQTNTTETLAENIYPIPKQLVLSGDESSIYYHDSIYVYQFNINNGSVTQIMDTALPIHTITVDTESSNVFFTSSKDGTIFRVSAGGGVGKYYTPMSVSGGPIYLDNDTSELYYSKGNGMDVMINSINIDTKELTEHVVLKFIPFIASLIVIE